MDSRAVLIVSLLIRKASIGMYSGCDKLFLQILFVYFLALPSLLNFIQLFFILVILFFCPWDNS